MAEQQEEFISNTLLKKIQELKNEKEQLARNYEQEEEFLTNDLSRKLFQVCFVLLGFDYTHLLLLLLLLLHPFNSLFSMPMWVSWYQKGKTSLDLNEVRDDGILGWQWHQLDHMQTICTLLKTDNHTASSLNFYRIYAFLTRNQECQSTEGKYISIDTHTV